MFRHAACLLAAAMIATAAQAFEDAPGDPAASIAKGRALVERNCGMCHAVGAQGDSPLPKAPRFRDLNDRLDMENLGEGLAQGILTSHPAMPEFRFQPQEVVSIVLYLKSIQNRRSVMVAAPDLR